MVRLKVCCISSLAEARLAIDHGAAALGLVSHMPSGPGVIADDLIASIAAAVPPPVATFLLTSRQEPLAIVEQQRRLGVDTIQICDRLKDGDHQVLRRSMPGIRLVQVIHVTDDRSIDEAVRVAPQVDALLLDSGNQSLPIKELGGTGRVHNWTISRRIRDAAGVPIFLAGGLTADNVAEAIEEVRPFGIDVCSGVRTNGALDSARLAAFVQSLQSAL